MLFIYLINEGYEHFFVKGKYEKTPVHNQAFLNHILTIS